MVFYTDKFEFWTYGCFGGVIAGKTGVEIVIGKSFFLTQVGAILGFSLRLTRCVFLAFQVLIYRPHLWAIQLQPCGNSSLQTFLGKFIYSLVGWWLLFFG